MTISFLLIGLACDYGLHRKFHPAHYPCTIFLSLITYLILWQTFHESLAIVKGFLFAQTLIVASYCDVQANEIPDILPVMILIEGFIMIEPHQAIIGFFVVSLPLLLIAKFTGGGVGGGDIKLMAACGFVLGSVGAVAGTIIGMLIFFSVYLIFYRKDRHKMYAMAPYFTTGCFIAYLLN